MRQSLIGILGGTFDPIHYGHLKPAQAICDLVGLDKLLLIPCYNPVHKPQPVASASQRVHMLELARSEYPDMIVDDREIKRSGPSYTVDTLLDLHAEIPGANFCLLLGSDALKTFDTWHHSKKILELAHLLVMTRPMADTINTKELNPSLYQCKTDDIEQLRLVSSGKVMYFNVGEFQISSTMVREYLQSDKSVSALLPVAVGNWLQNNKIYSAMN